MRQEYARHDKSGKQDKGEIENGHGGLIEAEALERERRGKHSPHHCIADAGQADEVPEKQPPPSDVPLAIGPPDDGSGQAGEEINVPAFDSYKNRRLFIDKQKIQINLDEHPDGMQQSSPFEVDAA